MRLFACACCREIWPLLFEEHRKAIELAELHADGYASKRALKEAIEPARAVTLEATTPRMVSRGWIAAAQARAAEAAMCALEADDPADDTATWAKEAVRAWARLDPAKHAKEYIINLPRQRGNPEAAWVAEAEVQCELMHDLFGNPFRPPPLNAAWRTQRVIALGKTILQERAFTRMGELAAVLEEAGCNNQELLNHCRDQKGHARGCWALDFAVGK